MPKSHKRLYLERLFEGDQEAVAKATREQWIFEIYSDLIQVKWKSTELHNILTSLQNRDDRIAIILKIGTFALSAEERSAADHKIAVEMYRYERELLE